ncbi:conjugal transfer protein TraF [Celeribacter naphthalenivorans]|uniref:conjugal transfer protein TraF n=1 Tax=Celeribacter naphthalenivorans TaxID=1614694 RepID=UPI001CF9FB61|nr:conjugal transfer protein TraF [Celeribacter naphthalenivorans]
MNRRHFITGLALAAMNGQGIAAEDYQKPTVGLIFIGASWCLYCKAAANALNAAAAPVELPILVASQDGKPIPPFPDFVLAEGHPLASDVVKIPTLLFVHVPSQTIFGKIEGFRNPRRYLTRVKQTLLSGKEAGYV